VSSSSFSGFTSARAEVSLNSQDGSFNLSIRTPFSEEQTIPFDLSGILFPNTYTLSANAYNSAYVFGIENKSGAADIRSILMLPLFLFLLPLGSSALVCWRWPESPEE
jgi:hypothetical protein